jgi:hypothetical protein
MIKAIKKYLFYKAFEHVQVKRKVGINKMDSVCILFDGTDENERKIIHKFKKQINPQGNKTVKSLAFINNRLALDNVDYDAYNLKDVNLYGIPKSEKTDAFIKYDFDLLIVICKKMLPHFEYIIAHSHSRFIIGPSITRATKYFHLTVDIQDNDDTNHIIQKFIKAIDTISIQN